jgi:predicted RNase H-like nuclease
MALTESTWLAGVDGCRGGWFVVLCQGTSPPRALRFSLCHEFSDVLALREKPRFLAVDIPIGLLVTPQRGGRACDREARRTLGGPRRSSVFTPPTRPALKARTYREAIRLNRQGLSLQAFSILAKIREVDQALITTGERRVYEAHPELAFAHLGGAAMQHNKKTANGRGEREHWLRCHYRSHYVAPPELRTRFGLRAVAADDILDAYALACTAARIASGHAIRLPAGCPPQDARDRPMEIWY